MAKLLKGAYKGKRKRKAPDVIIWIECPGCGWKGQPGKVTEAEAEYVLHLNNCHHGLLECAFCLDSVGRGLRFLPDFGTLAAHVRHFHPEVIAAHEKHSGLKLESNSLVPHSFK